MTRACTGGFPPAPHAIWAIGAADSRCQRVGRTFVASDARPPPLATLDCQPRRRPGSGSHYGKTCALRGRQIAGFPGRRVHDRLPQNQSSHPQIPRTKHFFDHAWRQTRDKLYVADMGGVDWDGYRKVYEKFLPHIADNHDFAELLSEMLGELNVSHTGSGYRPRNPGGDATASLGAFFDEAYTGNGLKIAEIIDGGPLAGARQGRAARAAGRAGHRADRRRHHCRGDGVRFAAQPEGRRARAAHRAGPGQRPAQQHRRQGHCPRRTQQPALQALGQDRARAGGQAHQQMWLCHFAGSPRGTAGFGRPWGAHEEPPGRPKVPHPPRGAAATPPGGALRRPAGLRARARHGRPELPHRLWRGPGPPERQGRHGGGHALQRRRTS